MLDDPKALLGGRYSLRDRIGEGGFGVVYEALDTELRRRVAIKVLSPIKAASSAEQAEQLRERFRREAIATAAVRHPNVVTIYDVGLDEEEVYIVMELLEGHPLSEELERWPTGIAATRALPLFVNALRGLHTGHQAGVVHKDLKPANLFLCAPDTPEETLRMIDFGVARVVHEQKLTATGKIVGTPRYLAPEYIQHLEVTPATDIYQMGLILVELLSSFPCVPRRLDLVTCCQRHVDGALKIADGLREGAIGEIIARATAVDPKKRFATAGEFADALAEVDPATVRPESAGERRATPRLGIVPLNKDTQPMFGQAVEAAATPGPPYEPEDTGSRRGMRTGPTKRLGSSAEIYAELAKITGPDDTDILPVEPPVDTQRATRVKVYSLVAIAVVATLATVAFLMLRAPATKTKPPAEAENQGLSKPPAPVSTTEGSEPAPAEPKQR